MKPFVAVFAYTLIASAQPPPLWLLVNDGSPLSVSIAEYYARRRSIPPEHLIHIRTKDVEEIERDQFNSTIKEPMIAQARRRGRLPRYLVVTQGVPLKIRGSGTRMQTDAASVDSELAALKIELTTGRPPNLQGPLGNPSYGRPAAEEPRILLVTRLAGFTFQDVKNLVDRALSVKPEDASRGMVVLDQHDADLDLDGNLWLLQTANRLPQDRVILEQTKSVVTGKKDLIGYASWGSNDRTRRVAMKGQRDLGFSYLPGAIATEFVSTNARTFREPPPQWRFGEWNDLFAYFAGSPQSLSADFIRQGVTGVSGHVYEPLLGFTPRPDLLFPAYLLQGRTLAEAFWTSIPAVSWMNVVIGDPLCRVK